MSWIVLVWPVILLLLCSFLSLSVFYWHRFWALAWVLLIVLKRRIRVLRRKNKYAIHVLFDYHRSFVFDLQSFRRSEKMILDYVIPLISCFLTSSLCIHFFYPVFALAFVATVPCLIRQICTWRSKYV